MKNLMLSILFLSLSLSLNLAHSLPINETGGLPIHSHEEVLAHEDAEKLGVQKMDQVFYYTEELLRRASMKKFLRKELREYLTISKEAQERYGFKSRLTDISEGQLYLLLYKNPQIYGALEDYINNVPIDTADHNKEDKEIAARFRGQFKEMMADPEVRDLFTRLNRPTKPVPLFFKNGKPGITDVNVFSSIPFHDVDFVDGRIEVSEHVNERQDLLKELLKFIDGAKEVIMLNVFEFDLMEIVDKLIDAHNRGVDVYIGIDKEHTHNEQREAIVHRLEEMNKIALEKLAERGITPKQEPVPTLDKPYGGLFKLTLVDTNNLNHQKIATRDFHLKGKGYVYAGSANWTAGGIHPGGDLHDNGINVERAMPNSNQATIYKSDTLAKLVAHELRKTLILGFKGTKSSSDNTYPLSNSYRIMGPVVESPTGPYRSHLVAAFTPNGGLDKANGFLLDNMLYYTEGPIGIMQFSASSNEVSDAIIERVIRDFQKHGNFELYGVSDFKGGISEWSIFLDIIGMQRVKLSDGTPYYVINPDSLIYKHLPEEAIKKLWQRVVIAPKSMFEHVKVTLADGTKKTITILQHAKIMMSGYTSTAGSSLNPSENSEKNQEQLFILSHPKVAKVIAGMIAYLYKQSKPSDVLYNMVLARNEKALKNKDKEIQEEARLLSEENRRLALDPSFAVCSNFFGRR